MLNGVDKSKLRDEYSATALTTHPYPVKDHVEKLSDLKRKPVIQQLSNNLQTMIHVKQIEDILTLYDQYDDIKQFKKLQKEVKDYKNINIPSFPFILSSISVLAYLKLYKRISPFMLQSYSNNLIGCALSFGFTFGITNNFDKYVLEEENNDSRIFYAKSVLHSQAVNLTNSLRFNKNEIY